MKKSMKKKPHLRLEQKQICPFFLGSANHNSGLSAQMGKILAFSANFLLIFNICCMKEPLSPLQS